MNAEQQRLEDDRRIEHFWLKPWRKWGPYLAERQWGTVREDYSAGGDAWSFITHEQARSKAYRWGEEGIAGISDDDQRLCISLALWNGRDPILKERLFGLSNPEGNHGEDAKELYYYLDATPTHSYLKYLYKYPQAEFPYAQLVAENRQRGRLDPEFELIDTGIFDADRYFDVFVEYAKADAHDLLMQVTIHNRGPDEASLTVLPQAWFRNTWSWKPGVTRPALLAEGPASIAVRHPGQAEHPEDKDYDYLEDFHLHADGATKWLFCDNETNTRRLYGLDGGAGFFKDAFDEYIVHGRKDAVNPAGTGTKVGAFYQLVVPARGSRQVRLRLTKNKASVFADFDGIMQLRRREADAFYADLQKDLHNADARLVQRQALANLIWSRQFYYLDIPQWLEGDPAQPTPPGERHFGRNHDWTHLNNADVLTMPDKWEYPWFAAWDSAFQCLPLALVDPEWAKRELVLYLREWYMHPNGQIPAYEWNFSDVNPPVHAWAAWRVFQIDRARHGGPGDMVFLERVFHKLMLNFTWWVNRKDAEGRNVFQGGFLGMDNIGVFDRSAPLPTGGYLNQADGTAWMAMYCLQLMRIALELALHNRVYEDIASKFFEHYLYIAEAMTNIGGQGIGLWDDEDRFYYDQLRLPNGQVTKLKVRSMVGFVPLFAVEVLDPELLQKLPDFERRLRWFLNYRPDLAALVSHWEEPGRGQRRLLSLLRGSRMKAILRRLLDETEFLSAYGPRTLSREYRENPFVFNWAGGSVSVAYRPADSDSGLFGGNSNWRGPIWFPVSFLIIESLQKFHHYYGDDFKVECPTGSGRFATINEVAEELSRRLSRIFVRDAQGRRAVFGAMEKLQNDPHFRDCLFFSEYFDGENGRGLGTLRQGWTCLVAKLLQPRKPLAPCADIPCPLNTESNGIASSSQPTSVRLPG